MQGKNKKEGKEEKRPEDEVKISYDFSVKGCKTFKKLNLAWPDWKTVLKIFAFVLLAYLVFSGKLENIESLLALVK